MMSWVILRIQSSAITTKRIFSGAEVTSLSGFKMNQTALFISQDYSVLLNRKTCNLFNGITKKSNNNRIQKKRARLRALFVSWTYFAVYFLSQTTVAFTSPSLPWNEYAIETVFASVRDQTSVVFIVIL